MPNPLPYEDGGHCTQKSYVTGSLHVKFSLLVKFGEVQNRYCKSFGVIQILNLGDKTSAKCHSSSCDPVNHIYEENTF